MKTCYWIIIPSVRKRLLNRHSSWWDVVDGERGCSQNRTLGRRRRGEGRRKKPFPLFLPHHFSLASALPFDRPPPSLFLVISSSRRPVSPDETLNWQSAFEGVNIAPPPPPPPPSRREMLPPRKQFGKASIRVLSLSLVEIYKKGGGEGGGGKGKFFTHFSGNV